jgi:hypothetical protein
VADPGFKAAGVGRFQGEPTVSTTTSFWDSSVCVYVTLKSSMG